MSASLRKHDVRSARAARRPGPFRALAFLGLSLAILAPAMAEAGQVTIAASADAVLEDSNGDGTFDKMDPASLSSNGIYVRDFMGGPNAPYFEDRAVVLFRLGDVPLGDLVTGLVLNLNETANMNSAGGIAIVGYSSSGTISLADATAAGSLAPLATFDATVGAGSHSIALDTTYVQSLLKSGATDLGIRLQGTERTVVTLFDSIESSRSSAPTLVVTYVVAEPSSAALLVSGLALGGLGMRFRAKRRRTV